MRGLAFGFGLLQLEDAPLRRLDLKIEIRCLELRLQIRLAPGGRVEASPEARDAAPELLKLRLAFGDAESGRGPLGCGGRGLGRSRNRRRGRFLLSARGRDEEEKRGSRGERPQKSGTPSSFSGGFTPRTL
ncbi:MAG: hypothetical protein PT977_13585 [Acidobacteriota bacterium]|nr:hypothetical protein [Acidobacteriota bacterium]